MWQVRVSALMSPYANRVTLIEGCAVVEVVLIGCSVMSG